MTEEELIKRIKNIRINKNGDKRAPHKPLLLLYALANLQRNSTRLMLYRDVKGDLRDLLLEFGPSVEYRHSTEDPFLRLYNDKIWEIDKEVNICRPNKKFLLDNNVSAGFSVEVYHLLKGNTKLLKRVTELLLEQHFQETLYEDILERVGLEFKSISIRKWRDPRYRVKILEIYRNKCAVCGFDVKLNNTPLAIEAAHIKWHKHNGPNIEGNGIALCAIHHKLFDQGAFTLNLEKEIMVSKKATGTFGLQEWLLDYDGKKINLPSNCEYQPKSSYINWHIREVFKSDYII